MWAKSWARLSQVDDPLSIVKWSKSGKSVTHFGCGPDAWFFWPKFGQSQIFFKALWAGLTNPHDISDSFTVTPLFEVLCDEFRFHSSAILEESSHSSGIRSFLWIPVPFQWNPVIPAGICGALKSTVGSIVIQHLISSILLTSQGLIMIIIHLKVERDKKGKTRIQSQRLWWVHIIQWGCQNDRKRLEGHTEPNQIGTN